MLRIKVQKFSLGLVLQNVVRGVVGMKQWRWIAAMVAVTIMIGSWGQILRSQQNLIIRSFTQSGVPMIFMAPDSPAPGKLPGVLVTHGYSGSKQLMLGYGHVLAHGGYGVLLWDNKGHGSNPSGFGTFYGPGSESNTPEANTPEANTPEANAPESTSRQSPKQPLDEPSPEFQTALAALKAQPEVDSDRIALLGHSLGGGTALQAGIQSPDEFSATIAISSVPAPVTYARPQNLQLQIGAWEFGMLHESAQALLQDAGGENPQLSTGKGRSLITVPKVEHTSILFSDRSHWEAWHWLERTFRPETIGASMPDEQPAYRDRRIAAYLMHLLAGLGFLGAIAPVLPIFPVTFKRPKSTWLGLVTAPLVAGGALVEINKQVDLATLGGIQVGGSVGLWLFIGGVVWLGFSGRFPRPSLQNIGVGLLLFAGLWFAFGAMAHVVWLPWLLVPARLKLWPLLALAVLPWMLAAGNVQKDAGVGRRFLIWLAQSLALMLGFGLTIVFVPSLFFMALLLPFFPLVLGMLSWIGAFYDDPWSDGIAGALFFGWMLAAVFPLV